MKNDSTNISETARRTTLDDLAGLAVIDVYKSDGPNLCGLIGLSRAATYKAVERGEFPSIRAGRRVRIPVPALLKLLGSG